MANTQVGPFRIQTVEGLNIKEPKLWRSSVFIHHGDEREAIEWIHEAGTGTTPAEASHMALEAGRAIAEGLDPDDSVKRRLHEFDLIR